MAMVREAVIVGGGHNGLVAATLLAKAGLKPLVLERADRAGGCSVTSEIAPGFRCPTLSHHLVLDAQLIRGLDLPRHGLAVLKPDALVTAPASDGRMLTLWADPARAAREIAAFSSGDGDRYPAFLASIAAVTSVVRTLLDRRPPPIDNPGAADLLDLLKTTRRFRKLARADAYRLLRWLPMAVADLVSEWFDSDPLRPAVAAGAVLGAFAGPRSAGTAAGLLLMAARHGHPVDAGWRARGGPGALSEALAGAARQAGAEVRTGAEVSRILVKDGAAAAVVLSSGEEIAARRVISNLDPRRTLLGLIDPMDLAPEFRQRVQHIRMRGTLSKVNFAVSALPAFGQRDGAGADTSALSGAIRIGATLDAIERAFDAAKYGRYSDVPWIELTIPSLIDPALAPAGQHVVSAYVQFTPYQLRGTTWDEERDRLGDLVTKAIADHAPGFDRTIIAREVITPLDLERAHGLTGGHIYHGELALDQLLVARPVLGWAQYESPVRGLHLCGSGVHPGTGLDGRSGMLAAREILKRPR